jgi:hypothetical protein
MDAEGTAVVIELKRGKHKLHMLQAIAYAGMVSRWDPEEFMRLMSEDQWEELSDFLDVDVEEMNRRQRLLLVAEGFDYALLAGAEWLSEQYGVDIRCAAVTLATDGSAEAQYVALTSIFPAPALAEQAVARGRGPRRVRPPKWGDWEAALTAIENAELREYARRELEGGRENGLQGRALHYRLDEKRRWSVRCRKKFAYVWQRGRFTGDETYWKERLSHPSSVSPVKAGSAVSFKLYTTSDFEAFRRAATVELAEAEWYDGGLPPNEGNPFDEDTEK